MTTNELQAEANNIFAKFTKNGDDNVLINLAERWRDEKEYEDWAEYKTIIQSRFAYLGNITQKNFHVYVKLTATAVQLCMKMI